ERPLDARRPREHMAAAIVARQRSTRLEGERLQQQPLRSRGFVPDEPEVRVLRAQELRQGSLVLLGSDGSALGRLLPEEVAELLRRVGMPMSCVQHPLDRVWLDRAARLRELRLDEAAEERRRDDAELHLLGTAPERLVLVGEDALEHVPLAAQVDVSDLWLPLEDRAH